MGNLGFWEIVALAVLALMIFGPERLPEMARNVGKAVSTFRREATSTLDELKRQADLEDIRGVADEFRTTAAELKKTSALTGPMASPARPRSTRPRTVSAETSAPFDPDAT
jgi:sec-independent protein translocase protein TatB